MDKYRKSLILGSLGAMTMIKPLIFKAFNNMDWRKWLMCLMVRERGVEPLRSYPLDPKSSASASSATLAYA